MPTNSKIQQQFQNLPKDLREAIFSVDTADIIQAIAKKHKLAIDKMGELADEVGLLMLGITHPKDFINHLERRLETDPETTRNITEEVNTQIFAKIRESLKTMHTVKEEREEILPEPKLPETKNEQHEIPSLPKAMEDEFHPSNEAIQDKARKSPFEEKLAEKVFKSPIQKEVTEAKKEGRYPGGQDPYREPIDNI